MVIIVGMEPMSSLTIAQDQTLILTIIILIVLLRIAMAMGTIVLIIIPLVITHPAGILRRITITIATATHCIIGVANLLQPESITTKTLCSFGV